MRKKYRSIPAVLVAIVMLLFAGPVQASQVQNGTVYPIDTNTIVGWPQGPEMYSETAVLMEAETGTILYSKGMDEKRYPASITKIMTALIVLENCQLDEQVIFTEDCLPDEAPGSVNIGMQVGEILTVKQCLMAALIQSANEVSTQLAVHTAGSVEAFAEMMNEKAAALGCKNTHFANANGLPNEDHYTSAHDMALIFREALKYDVFREIIETVGFTLEPTNMNPQSRSYTTHHSLLSPITPEHYEGCFGGKTGYTDEAASTLVSGAEKNGMTLIAVAMRAEGGQVCQDHIQLFNYGFENFQKVEVPGGKIFLPTGKSLSDVTVSETEEDGIKREEYYFGGTHFVGSVAAEKPAVTDAPAPSGEPEAPSENPPLPEKSQNTEHARGQIGIMIIFVLLLLVGIAFYVVTVLLKKKKKRKRKRRR